MPHETRLIVGSIIRANNGSGAYVVDEIRRNCVCQDFIARRSGTGLERPEHFHVAGVPVSRDRSGAWRRANYRVYLAGSYVETDDGRIVSIGPPDEFGNQRELFLEGFMPGAQAELLF